MRSFLVLCGIGCATVFGCSSQSPSGDTRQPGISGSVNDAAAVGAVPTGAAQDGAPDVASADDDGDGNPSNGELIVVWQIPEQLGSGTVNFAVTGPAHTAGSLNFGPGSTFQFTLSLPRGTNYDLSLEATSLDEAFNCENTETFSLPSSAPVTLPFTTPCEGFDGGALQGCASWKSVSVTPNDIVVGASAHVTFSATGPSPGQLTYAASGASLVATPASGALDANGTGSFDVTCVEPGDAVLHVTFADGPAASCESGASEAAISLVCLPAGSLDASAD
jgi:hypothetical protein